MGTVRKDLQELCMEEVSCEDNEKAEMLFSWVYLLQVVCCGG